MPPARWRRLPRSHSCVSCHSESGWRLSSRFRTSPEYHAHPSRREHDGLVEIITTAMGRDRDQLVVLSGLHGPAQRGYRDCDLRVGHRAKRNQASGGLKVALWRCTSLPTTSRRSACRRRADLDSKGRRTPRDSGIPVLAEPPEFRSGIIGKTLKLDNVPYVVAGIAPDQFQGHLGLQGRELFVPLERYPFYLRTARLVSTGQGMVAHHGRLSQGLVLRRRARRLPHYSATGQRVSGDEPAQAASSRYMTSGRSRSFALPRARGGRLTLTGRCFLWCA